MNKHKLSSKIIFGILFALIGSTIILWYQIDKNEFISKTQINNFRSDKTTLEDIAYNTNENISLVKIFEQNESGLVKIDIQKEFSIAESNNVGSGFVYDKKGHIITSEYKVDEAKKIIVTFLNGKSYNAHHIGKDHFTNIGVIKVDAEENIFHPIRFGNSSNLKIGEPVAFLGNPYGLSGTMTAGIISQLGHLVPVSGGYYITHDAIQTDALIGKGSGGSPLVNMNGEIVGMATAFQAKSGEYAGIGFAIPSSTMEKVIPTIIREGKYYHPWVGWNGMSIDGNLADVLGLSESGGFLVVTVVNDSPASKAGLQGSEDVIDVEGTTYPMGGDIVLKADGKSIKEYSDLSRYVLLEKSIGDILLLEILRGGDLIEVEVFLEERP